MKTASVRVLGLFGILFSLIACAPGGTATDMMVASTGMKNMLQATQPPSAADMALSCPEVTTRLNNLYARYQEVDRQQRARASQAAMVDGVLGVGTHLVGGQLLGVAGSSVQGMQAAAAATSYGSSALGQVITGETSAQKLRDVNDATLLAQRIGQLEKVKFEKFC